MRACVLALATAVRLQEAAAPRVSGVAPPSRQAGRALLLQQKAEVKDHAVAASAVAAHAHSTLQTEGKSKAAAHQAPAVYVDKIGIGNVTTPTLLPPPPPVLNPVTDYQPLDTALGDFVLKQFVEPPTVTPPPLQSQLDLANACPIMLPAPDTMFVTAPTSCERTGRHGQWRDATEQQLMVWTEASKSSGGVAASFVNPIGDAFGSINQELRLSGTKVDFLDCGLNILYTMTETVYVEEGETDHRVCDAYGICDKSIYLKYEISKTGSPGVGAFSALVPIFANEFTLYDKASQNPVLTAAKAGTLWKAQDPPAECTNPPVKEWSLKFHPGNGHLADPGVRWVLGFAVTSMSLRDEDRSMDGKVYATTTEAITWAILAGLIFGGSCLVYTLLWAFDKYLKDQVTVFCLKIETSFFPTTMYKNKFYS